MLKCGTHIHVRVWLALHARRLEKRHVARNQLRPLYLMTYLMTSSLSLHLHIILPSWLLTFIMAAQSKFDQSKESYQSEKSGPSKQFDIHVPLHGAPDLFTQDLMVAYDHHRNNKLSKCVEACKLNLTRPEISAYFVIKNLCLMADAAPDWKETEVRGFPLSSESRWRHTNFLTEDPPHC
jgi:hypothetical protein